MQITSAIRFCERLHICNKIEKTANVPLTHNWSSYNRDAHIAMHFVECKRRKICAPQKSFIFLIVYVVSFFFVGQSK